MECLLLNNMVLYIYIYIHVMFTFTYLFFIDTHIYAYTIYLLCDITSTGDVQGLKFDIFTPWNISARIPRVLVFQIWLFRLFGYL